MVAINSIDAWLLTMPRRRKGETGKGSLVFVYNFI